MPQLVTPATHTTGSQSPRLLDARETLTCIVFGYSQKGGESCGGVGGASTHQYLHHIRALVTLSTCTLNQHFAAQRQFQIAATIILKTIQLRHLWLPKRCQYLDMYTLEEERVLLDFLPADRVGDSLLGLQCIQPIQSLAVGEQLKCLQHITWFPYQTHFSGELCAERYRIAESAQWSERGGGDRKVHDVFYC